MIKRLLILVAIAVVAISCSSSDDSPQTPAEPALLKTSQDAVGNALYSIWDDADTIAAGLVANNNDETITRSLFDTFLVKHPEILEIVSVTDSGKIRYIEPAEYKSAEGSDISAQPQVLRLFAENHRIISDVFKLVEGYTAIVMESPLQQNNKCVGSCSPIFKPNDFIHRFTDSIITPDVDDFFVMQTNGDIVYDIDPAQSGRNLFTDTLYQDFPQLLAAGEKVISQDAGYTTYSFLDKTKQQVVNKSIWWRTSDYYGTKWKFCIVEEMK